MKKILMYILLILSIFMVGCASKNGEASSLIGRKDYGMYATDGAPDASYSPSYSSEYASEDASISDEPYIPMDGEEPIEEVEPELPQSGQLTASVVFDNDKYDFWKSLITKGQDDEGSLYQYINTYKFDTTNRIKVTTKGIVGAKVTIDGKYSGLTDSNGVVYLFPSSKDSYNLEISYKDNNGKTVTITETITEDYEYIPSEEVDSNKNLLQIMFVIDTTGSMGDEIRYLQSEITSVINRVKEENPNVVIELALVFYRDFGDQYVTKSFDFTTNINSQNKNLGKQYADGGGDWEEAVHEGFKEANNQSWKEEAKTKLLVFVADAPCHTKDVDSVIKEVNSFCEKGIRVISVASSGIDKGTEFLFRSICIETNGAYGYLTNDSGIGGYHVEATTEEKPVVEYLNNMLVRLINGFYTGQFADPIPWRGQSAQENVVPEELPE